MIKFESANKELKEGFRWAVEQALVYAHYGNEPVGLWYEAALPSRQAFCMRDVSHQMIGANIIGLQKHNKNMLSLFAKNISESKDWCSYWEIDCDNKPAPVDYTSDDDFWYNLPANFDIVNACYRQFLWTGDAEYITNHDFDNFYKRSLNEYIAVWDKDGDGIQEYYPENGRRGLCSYNEESETPLIAGDLVAAQYTALHSFAKMLVVAGNVTDANIYQKRAEELQSFYMEKWWDTESKLFYGGIARDKTFIKKYYNCGNSYPIYFEMINDADKLKHSALRYLENEVDQVELLSHQPEILYKSGLHKEAYQALLKIINKDLPRREYPEVSYSALASIIRWLMGIHANGIHTVYTLSRLTTDCNDAEIKDLDILHYTITVKHIQNSETHMYNSSSGILQWQPQFLGHYEKMFINGEEVTPKHKKLYSGETITYYDIDVVPCKTYICKV